MSILFFGLRLGFANTALGLVGSLSAAVHTWRMPAAVAGALFYGLAAAHHVRHGARTRNQTVAMVSDLAFAFVLVALGVAARIRSG